MKDTKPLPFLTPEQAGVPSGAISRLLDRLEAARLCMHSIIILRRGSIIAEGYWEPFCEGEPHRMYSSSKSVTSMAIGKLYDNGLIRLDDRIADYFPDKLPENPSPYTMAATIRDLLMMATQNDCNSYTNHDTDWIWTFFNSRANHMPGTIFQYDTAATTVLCALVERLTGKTFYEYLRPEFDIIGVSPDTDCIEYPGGGAWGGSGLLISTRDYAKIVLLCQRMGNWNGKQLISEEYMRAATSRQIDNSHESHPGRSMRERPGYGYQFWVIGENGFKLVGMGSQSALVFPEQDLIVATTADNQGNNYSYEIDTAVYEELLPALGEPLPADDAAYSHLCGQLSSLKLATQWGEHETKLSGQWNGRKFVMDENDMGITELSLSYDSDSGRFDYVNAQGKCSIAFGFGHNVEGLFPQTNYYGRQIGSCPGDKYRCFASAGWVEPHKLMLRVLLCDRYFGNFTAVFSFKENTVSVLMRKTAEWFLEEYDGFACGHCE